MTSIQAAIEKIRSVGEEYCENQVYFFIDAEYPMECDITALCERLRIPYTDDLMIRYPANRTFAPMDRTLIEQQEADLGITLPDDYKSLLEAFGEFHLPGDASVCIDSPEQALRMTRNCWCYEGKPLRALAISSYHDTSDGNSIGFIRDEDVFAPPIYEFDHDKLHHGDDPALWTAKLADSLADFIVAYLDRRE